MNDHTPGPWKAYRGAVWSTHESVSGPVTKGMRTNHVCAISERLKMPDGEREANACLIAAAPEMLAALEACLPWLGKAVFYDLASLPVQTSKEDLSSVLSMAGKAIAKARGES